MVATHSFQPYTYEVPLEVYMQIYNKRFPQHKLFPFILDSQVVEHIVEENGNEKSIRKTKLDIDAPGWFKSIFNIHHSIFIEESYYDKAERKVIIKTTNETLNTKAKLEDITVYSVHKENPNWCQFTQTGNVQLLVSVFGFQKKIENYVLDLYSSRYDESRKLDLQMIEQYKDELMANYLKQQQEQQTNTQPILSITTETNIQPNTIAS
ncbi:hypothetical protein DLAC_01597 [Tieghemostelium lacteum]|uniref:PRELI/MSF1 domain-containing protein n=1 Tax=Tieghemostelium lacteum TaxID=361077 RepID=A0A152A6A3_TIELA|nr:hypothetical protein DLAC_01597 [Tieghemostelium lacteum]|eukprot:KYR01597.1 hypothetical protein DLAC_01597 [Tieghemostelium lacteum]